MREDIKIMIMIIIMKMMVKWAVKLEWILLLLLYM